MTKRPIVIGLTGGIATGKSSVLELLRRQGIRAISSDDLAHDCLRRGHPCYKRILRHFGPRILSSKRQIDRRRLGQIVFASPKERKWLERQIHPQVIRQLGSFIRKHLGWVALDIPLLFEARLENLVDASVVVSAPRKVQLQRLKRRDGLLPAAALLRIKAQMPLELKRKRADYVLQNSRTLAELKRQVKHLLSRIRRDAAQGAGPFG